MATTEPFASVPVPRFCGAKLRKQNKTCRQPAGKMTPHLGQGRCWLHGGLTPIKHGRYSVIKSETIRELATHFEQVADPLNILPELAQARALYADFINRYEAYRAALLAWHESYRAGARPIGQDRILALAQLLDEYETLLGGEASPRQAADIAAARGTIEALGAATDGKPMQLLDIADAYKILETVSRMVKRVEDATAANAISRADLLRIMQEMGRVVITYEHDEAIQQQIRDGWLTIRF